MTMLREFPKTPSHNAARIFYNHQRFEVSIYVGGHVYSEICMEYGDALEMVNSIPNFPVSGPLNAFDSAFLAWCHRKAK